MVQLGGKGDIPTVDDRDVAAVAELATLAGDGQATEGGPAEVEVGFAGSAWAAIGALVGDDDRGGAASADGAVEAHDLVAGAAALPAAEQRPAPRRGPRLEWL